MSPMPTLPAVERRTIELAGLAVPFVEVTGSDGPTLTVIAGVHGCEYASMDGVRRWLRGLEGQELRGRVRAVPVLNMTAFAARTPFVVPEGGQNLNPPFPGDRAGTIAERLAYDAFTQLITGSDAYIDAHCGDMVEALQPFALYEAGPAEDQARELAAAYGLPYVIRQAAGPGRAVTGTSSASAAAAGIPAITADAGGRCAESGWWAPAVKAGDAVTQGQVIGTVSSLDGATVQETITAPADGVVIFVTRPHRDTERPAGSQVRVQAIVPATSTSTNPATMIATRA